MSNETHQAAAARAEREIPPAVAELLQAADEQILARAKAEGWSVSQAEWIARLAHDPLIRAVADDRPGMEALEEAYGIARRKLAEGYFTHALAEGKSRYAAFLTVIDLERQVAERRGAAAPDYPDPVLLAACRAVEAAAAEEATPEEQIATGYAAIRQAAEIPMQ